MIKCLSINLAKVHIERLVCSAGAGRSEQWVAWQNCDAGTVLTDAWEAGSRSEGVKGSFVSVSCAIVLLSMQCLCVRSIGQPYTTTHHKSYG